MMKKNSKFQQFTKSFFGRGVIVKICFVVVCLLLFCAIFAPVLTKYTPTEQSLVNKLKGPSKEHLLGTDRLGRDLLTRLLYGARISLVTSVLSSLIAATIGTVMGLVAGYFKGAVSQIIMRITDAQLSIPPLILTMVLASLFGGGVQGVSIVIGISLVPTYVRIVYSLVISQKESDYVIASKLIGERDSSILFRHLLPNCFPSIIVLFTMNLGTAIMLESSLSFLGMGITPPTPAWGSMVSEGYSSLRAHPLIALLPGICVMITVVSFNILGDSLRDTLDPRLRGKL